MRLPFIAVFVCFAALLPARSVLALKPGDEAPTFALKTYDGREVSSAALKDKVVVLEWFNSGCPFVAKHYRSGHMPALQKEYSQKGVTWLVLNSTNPGHRDFLSPQAAKKVASDWKIESASMLVDDQGAVGRIYEAKTTPHVFIIDRGTLVYQGGIDDDATTDGDPKQAKKYVKEALDAVLAGKPVPTAETKPYGCSVKY